MIELKDIHSLSDFKRKTSSFVARLKKTNRPAVLTVNGKAALVVQDAESYQRLLNRAEQIEMFEFLRESRADIDAGRTRPADEVIRELTERIKNRAKSGAMTNDVVVTARAEQEIDRRVEWLEQHSPIAALKWLAQFDEAKDTLRYNPMRFGLAPESAWIPGIRETYFGKRGGKFRILFEIRGETVYVLRVRHGARSWLEPGEL